MKIRDQNGKSFIPPFPLSLTYYWYFQSLLTGPVDAPPPLFRKRSTQITVADWDNMARVITRM